jgi:hypothetical protein
MLTRKRRIALMFILFNLIYIPVTMFFMRSEYQLPGIINFTWIMIGCIGGAWFVDVYQRVQNK